MMEGLGVICSKKNTRHIAADGLSEIGLADGGLVGGIRPGQGLANLASGFRDGQMDYRRMKAFDEDRDYLQKQRDRQEKMLEMQMKVRAAASQFAATDGMDVKPLIDLYHQSNPGAAKLDLARNADGTFALNVTRPDGTTETKPMKPEEVRTFGMHMTQALSNPEIFFANQEKLDERRQEFQRRLDLEREKARLIRDGRAARAVIPKPVKYPGRGVVLDARELIGAEPDLASLSTEDQQRMAFNVAARMQKLLSENPGTDAAEAMSQALDEERANVAPGEKRDLFGIDLLARDRSPTYQSRRRGVSAATPSANEPTAVNPKTGERIVYRNGQWRPLR